MKRIYPIFLIAFLLILFVLPLLILLMLSFSTRWQYPQIWPESLGLRPWIYLFRESPGFLQSLMSSLAYSLAAGILALVLCLLPARVLGRENFPGKGWVESLLLSPILLPVMTFSMGIHILFLKMGWTGTSLGVIWILTLYNYPYMLRALIAGYRQIPREMTQTAKNLGASTAEVILRVEVPSLLPAIAAGFPILFLTAFSEYFLVFLIGGGAVPSLTGYLYPFIRGSDYPLSSLLVLIFLILPVLLFILQDTIVHHIYKRRSLQ